VQLPSSFQESLVKLNSTLPTFVEIKEKVNQM
jgi:hypothetical protein